MSARKPIWREPIGECGVCGREMPAKNLDRHIAAHDMSRTFQCQECSFNAFDVLQLKKHYRKRHKLSTPSIVKLLQKLKQPDTYVRSPKRALSNGLRREGRMSLPDMRRSLSTQEVEDEKTRKPADRRESLDTLDVEDLKMLRTRTRTSLGTPEVEDERLMRTRDRRQSSGTPEVEEERIMKPREKRLSKVVESDDAASERSESSTSTDTHNVNAAVDEVLRRMPYLKPRERIPEKERGFHPLQRVHLHSVFELTWHPTQAQKRTMNDKLGVPLNNLRYFFDNNRRKVLRLQEKGEKKNLPKLKPRKTVLREKATGILTYKESDLRKSKVTLEEHIESGEAICIGVNLNSEERRCLLCDFKCSLRLKFAAHLRSHRFEPKFCGFYREQGELEVHQKGCRKHFSEDTFDEHTCVPNPPVFFKHVVTPDRRSSAISETDPDSNKSSLLCLIKEMVGKGPVCIAYDDKEDVTHCTMCQYSGSSRGNMFRHIIHHGLTGYKFCRHCRKIFVPETFSKHICNEQTPEHLGYFPLCKGPKRLHSPPVEGSDDEECDEESEDEEEEDDGPTEESIAKEMAAAGKPVCVGYEISDSCSQCTFCSYSCPVRGNLCKHIRAHGFMDISFCKTGRENSVLPKQANKGCRKIFTTESFDYHRCDTEDPPQLGEFQISRGQQGPRKNTTSKSGGRFAVPDGSPAKFYCDGYTRLFHRLGSKEKHAFPMDSTFIRNGQLELTSYLTSNQMKAVREFCWGSDKYFLVGI